MIISNDEEEYRRQLACRQSLLCAEAISNDDSYRLARMSIVRVFVASVALAIVTPSATLHGQCVVLPTYDEQFASADAVFVGTVLANEPTGLGGAHQIEAIAIFRLERSWKGPRDSEVSVGSDHPLEIGKRYVVFAFGKLGQPLTTATLCRWTEVIDRAKEKLDWLSKQPSVAVRFAS